MTDLQRGTEAAADAFARTSAVLMRQRLRRTEQDRRAGIEKARVLMAEKGFGAEHTEEAIAVVADAVRAFDTAFKQTLAMSDSEYGRTTRVVDFVGAEIAISHGGGMLGYDAKFKTRVLATHNAVVRVARAMRRHLRRGEEPVIHSLARGEYRSSVTLPLSLGCDVVPESPTNARPPPPPLPPRRPYAARTGPAPSPGGQKRGRPRRSASPRRRSPLSHPARDHGAGEEGDSARRAISAASDLARIAKERLAKVMPRRRPVMCPKSSSRAAAAASQRSAEDSDSASYSSSSSASSSSSESDSDSGGGGGARKRRRRSARGR